MAQETITRRVGLASVSLAEAKAIGMKMVADGRFDTLSAACRAGLRRLAEEPRDGDRALGEAGVPPTGKAKRTGD